VILFVVISCVVFDFYSFSVVSSVILSHWSPIALIILKYLYDKTASRGLRVTAGSCKCPYDDCKLLQLRVGYLTNTSR